MRSNRIFANRWTLRLLSLVFAIILHIAVSSENNQFTQASRMNNASVNITETISNVPVFVGETDADIFVTGLPESVNVEVTGPRNIINQATTNKVYVVTEDLTGVATGNRTVRLDMKGLPEGVGDYKIIPSHVVVEIGRLEEVTVPVEYEVDEKLVAEGYSISGIDLNPKEVTLTGRSDVIDQFKRAVVRISADQAMSESFTQTYTLQVEDGNGELLDVNSSVSEVTASVNIDHAGKTLNINIVPEGEDTSKFKYQYAFTDVSSVLVDGDAGNLDNISSVDAIVNVEGMDRSGVRTASLQLPDGIEGINYREIPISVTVLSLEENSANSQATAQETSEDDTPESESTENEE